MKKLLLGLGTLATITAPIAAVISCGSDEKIKGEINLEEVASPQALIDLMNEKMHFKMEGTDGTRYLESKDYKPTDKGLKSLHNYMSQMNSDLKFNFKFHDEKFSLDMSVMNDAIKNLKNLINGVINKTKKLLDPASVGPLMLAVQTGALPHITAMTGDLIGSTNAIKMLPWLMLGTSVKLDVHEYFSLLSAWHKAILPLIQSKIFKDWIKGKTYGLIGGISEDGSVIDSTIKPIAPGEKYDDKTYAQGVSGPAMIHPEESSNFEALLSQNILNLTAINDK